MATNASGAFSFSSLADGTYWVVVDSRTLGAASYNGGFNIGDVWAEQTYGDDSSTVAIDLAARYGGRNAATSDIATNASNAEHVARVVIAGGNVTGVNYGFSFNAIVTNRGDSTDDDAGANRMQQGTLRQFILNSNAIAGVQSAEFQIGAVGSAAVDRGHHRRAADDHRRGHARRLDAGRARLHRARRSSS